MGSEQKMKNSCLSLEVAIKEDVDDFNEEYTLRGEVFRTYSFGILLFGRLSFISKHLLAIDMRSSASILSCTNKSKSFKSMRCVDFLAVLLSFS